MADFPTAFTNAVDGSTDVLAKHINNLETKVGIDGSAVTTSHDYKLSGVTGTDKAVSKTGSEVLTNKTLTSPVLTTPQINDTSADHQYVVAVNELAADRTVTLPLLTGNDEIVFKDHAVTLTNKTLTSPVINTQITGTAIIDEDTMSSNSDVKVPTQQSVKAYVDTSVAASILSSKIISTTRDLSAISGDVSYTGAGFAPRAVIVFYSVSGISYQFGMGITDSAATEKSVFGGVSGAVYPSNNFIQWDVSGGNSQAAVVKTLDADGFTLTWTKTGSPTGTLTMQFLCLR